MEATLIYTHPKFQSINNATPTEKNMYRKMYTHNSVFGGRGQASRQARERGKSKGLVYVSPEGRVKQKIPPRSTHTLG